MDLVTFILGIAVLIFIHELGHFFACRIFKVDVEEFGIGFPPRAVKLFEHKGTVFSLNWIPLGGFVRPKGENDPDVPGGLASATPWVRLGVLFAGPLMNLLTGMLLGIFLVYSLGEAVPDKVLISAIAPGSPAEQAGIQPGDLVLEVAGVQITSVSHMQELIDQNLGRQIALLVQRGEQTLTVELTPRTDPPEGEGPMGVGLTNPTRPISIDKAVTRGSVAAFEQVRGILVLPLRMVRGEVSPEEGRLVGYKGMFDIYQRIQSPLWFFMAISISLGVMNLLPIPALDGGRILLTLPEILFRRRVPAQYENVIHMVGFALLILLLIYINVQDFLNPIQLP
ncbi:MAG: M50 family metallopeptidase [Chloroflexota bacterium]